MRINKFLFNQRGSAMVIVLLLMPVLTGIGLGAYHYSRISIPLKIAHNAEMQCLLTAESVYEDIAADSAGSSATILFDFLTPSGSTESVTTSGPDPFTVNSHQKYGGLNYLYKQITTVTTTTSRFFFTTTTTTEVQIDVTVRAYNKSSPAWDDIYSAEKRRVGVVGDASGYNSIFFFF